MKLAPVLAQYLYSKKRLSLPGIGVLQLDPTAYIEQDNSKGNKTIPIGNISFQCDTTTKSDEELIQFISAETGKMKPLATSDFASYLELMQQFLNIGKPFVMDGIGTLVKNTNGIYDFTPGLPLNEKITETIIKDNTANTAEDIAIDFKGMYKKHDRAGFTMTKAFIALLLFGGIAVAIWGGYALYNKNKDTVATTVNEPVPQSIVPVLSEDSILLAQKAKTDDSLKQAALAKTPGYKFIFETTPNKKRAINRYNFIKKINSDIHLETTDSTIFNITVNMDIPASDTLRVKGSLNSWYWGGKDLLVRIASTTSLNVP